MIDIKKTKQALYEVKRSIARNILTITITGAEYSTIMENLNDDTNLINIENAIDELERLQAREQPEKPSAIEYCAFGISVGICKCGIHVDSSQNYCDNCGQALDWSDV